MFHSLIPFIFLIIFLIYYFNFQFLGYYEEGSFGIRIETVCITVEAKVLNQFNGKKSCELETVTLAPIATNLIISNMLSLEETTWLNSYHKRVREILLPIITDTFPEAVHYLVERTQPI